MHLDFRQLRNFVALVEYGSFNRAAEAVCLSQSAFSRSIQALEQSVGHPLFDRQSKLPTLTLHGQKLLPYARRFQELNIELSSSCVRRTMRKMARSLLAAARLPARG